jgi:hypothetical protein
VRFFSRPHLKRSLIYVLLLLIITNAYITVIAQPAAYWLDNSQAISTAPAIGGIMAKSPWLFAGVTAAYLFVVWLLLFFLPRFPALILWMPLSLLHLRDTVYWSKFLVNQLYTGPYASIVCGIVDFLLVVTGGGILGIVLAKAWFGKETLATSDSHRLTPKRRFPAAAVLATLAWISLLTFALVKVAAIPDSGWLPITANVMPAPRVDAKIVFDTKRQRAILFGGATSFLGNDRWITENDTWEWDGQQWIARHPETSPPSRVAHGLAYDKSRDVTVLFGGKSYLGPSNDTWEWDGTNWTQKFSSNSPLPRCCHQMYYDSENGKVRMYGGYDGIVFYDDLWEWDGVVWQKIANDSPNPVASGFSLAYNSDRQQLVTFLAGFPDGTWILQDKHWSEPRFESEPPPRSGVGLVYDEASHMPVLFGGLQEGKYYNDTWLFSEGWQEVESPLMPQARWGHSPFYDENRGRVILFGGFDGESYMNDMWELIIEKP